MKSLVILLLAVMAVSHKDAIPVDICAEVKKDVNAFAGTAPQFDDITMLLVRYWGPEGGLI